MKRSGPKTLPVEHSLLSFLSCDSIGHHCLTSCRNHTPWFLAMPRSRSGISYFDPLYQKLLQSRDILHPYLSCWVTASTPSHSIVGAGSDSSYLGIAQQVIFFKECHEFFHRLWMGILFTPSVCLPVYLATELCKKICISFAGTDLHDLRRTIGKPSGLIVVLAPTSPVASIIFSCTMSL